MARRAPKRLVVYKQQPDMEFGVDFQQMGHNASGASGNMPKGNNSGNQEVLMLLQKISQQLEQNQSPPPLQNPLATSQQENYGSNKTDSQSQPMQPMQGALPQEENNLSQKLQNAFSQLLQSKPTDAAANNSNQNQQARDGSNQSQQDQQNQQMQAITVKTASQALAAAQYELANELEVSLKKLKQVISESEKLANRISHLLGQENNSNKSR